ncbi:YceI family protein, partial [Streptomyces sp. LB8]|uniref:YceI family protein n=1 Tax=Streptomyces sp. LB8 TaxID=3042509 RepID=UPI002649BFA1
LMSFIRLLFTALFVLGASAQSHAAIEKYTFDQPHTQIMFFVNHLGFSISEGEFQQVDGSFTFDTESPENSMIDVSIPTA